MFSSLLRRSRHGSRRVDSRDRSFSPSAGPASRRYSGPRHASADFTEADDDDDEDDDDDAADDLDAGFGIGVEDADADNRVDDNEDGEGPGFQVLPLFSSSHLDSLPVYSITHSIRIIVCARTETTLTWEQLRSPQVSQFLVKPMQQQIRTQHFSRSTLYALMANCLQFTKEGQRYAANAGTSTTRAKVCELLAIKMLKEYTTRELIDALAYDFYPLQGIPGAKSPPMTSNGGIKGKNQLTASRTSTLEVAIRASAKHFLAHPVVIQQLEAIWNGAITFYTAADSLHREPLPNLFQNTNGTSSKIDVRTPLLGSHTLRKGSVPAAQVRRTVMLYDPRQASIFKLSRLRVPRYRSFLSTISLAVLIGLFLAVLAERSIRITGLELVFWFWSAGFMVDELVGFTEQGFSLYIMSFWNIFDLGILVLLIAYYCMRAYGVFLVDPHLWNDNAYDVLAANAILLLPRIFSILDHYPYFSQLLIAFRLMAVDLAAVFILILIACSGFFVFFTLSNNANDAGDVAYQIFQILMGFTPAAWDVWTSYNWLAKCLMASFLIICHFLVVTILITVLTNSFLKIASNASEEHQFLFAINTISMVKNDALFSYIAPTNIFAWAVVPLRYCMPLKYFVWLNRTIIKVTHFPILLCIYLYERLWLAPSVFEPTDLVENQSRVRVRSVSFADPAHRTALFSPNIRAREESVAGYQKDQALEEVFKKMPDIGTLRTKRRNERHKAQTAIRNWMDQHDEEGASPANWPTLDSRAAPEWHRRLSVGWDRDRTSNLRQVSDARSIASDPADLMSNVGGAHPPPWGKRSRLTPVTPEYKDHTDADGDDELVTNDEDDEEKASNAGQSHRSGRLRMDDEGEDYFTTPMTTRPAKLATSQGSSSKGGPKTPRPAIQRKGLHSRTLSTNTILYRPEEAMQPEDSLPKSSPKQRPGSRQVAADAPPPGGSRNSPRRTPPRHASPRRPAYVSKAEPRPILHPRGMTDYGAVTRSALLSIEPKLRPREARRLSSLDLSALSDNINLPYAGDDPHPGMPSSFQTQMAMAMMKTNRGPVVDVDAADRDRMGRLVLARMKTLEESFAVVIKEMRDLKNSSTGPPSRRNSSGDELRSAHSLEMTTARDRPKKTRGDVTPKRTSLKRPGSRRSPREQKQDIKGKGKELADSTDDEAQADDGFMQKGSSM